MEVNARRLTVGPLEVELRLDGALAGVAPASWGNRAEPLPARARAIVRLAATDERPPLSEAHGFRDHRFCGGGCRLERRSTAPFVDEIEGVSAADPLALARAVRFATQPILADAGVLLLHASSVVIAGAAHLFVAPSGTGKSTIARALADAGAELLGDEVAAVGSEGVAVHPGQSPHGVLGRVVPLGTIHLLTRGGPRSTPVSAAQATAILLSQAMVYEDGPRAISRTMQLVSELVARARIVQTDLPLGDAAVRFLVGGAA